MATQKAYRRGTSLPRITLSLSAEDRARLDRIKADYRRRTSIDLSFSIIVGLSLAALHDQVQRGQLPLQAHHYGFEAERP